MARSLLENKTRNFWNEIKNIRSNSYTSPSQLDNIASNSGISTLFASKYMEFNGVMSPVEATHLKLLI